MIDIMTAGRIPSETDDDSFFLSLIVSEPRHPS